MRISQLSHAFRFVTTYLLLSVMMGMAVFGAARLHAQTGTTILACGGTNASAYIPGITFANRSVDIHSNRAYACAPVGSNPELTGGSASNVATLGISCLSLIQLGTPNTITYNWNDGSQSVVDYTASVISATPVDTVQMVSTGTVVSGFGQGALATETNTLPNYSWLQFQNACATSEGVRTSAGPVVLTFIRLL